MGLVEFTKRLLRLKAVIVIGCERCNQESN